MINVASQGIDGGDNKMIDFASGIKQQMQKVVAKDNVNNAISDMMKNIKNKRAIKEREISKEEALESERKEKEFTIDKKNSVFNKSLEEETKTINNIA